MTVEFRRTGCLRWALTVAGVALGCIAPLAAQTPDTGTSPQAAHERTIIGGPPAPATLERCVEVEVGGDKSFGCLNQKLKREVDRNNPTLNLPPLDARSPDVRVGNVNEAAVRQQYGSNYGKSVIPYRPQAPTYVLPRR